MIGRQYHSTVRQMSSAEAAWVGAMVEGEGTVSGYPTSADGYYRGRVRVCNSEVETLSTVLRFVGDGRVGINRHNDPARRHHLTMWSWYLHNQESLRVFLPQIIPWLTGKQARAQTLLEDLEERIARI